MNHFKRLDDIVANVEYPKETVGGLPK
jgi:hypothetical protein